MDTEVQIRNINGTIEWVTLNVLSELIKETNKIVERQKVIERTTKTDADIAAMMIWPWFLGMVICALLSWLLSDGIKSRPGHFSIGLKSVSFYCKIIATCCGIAWLVTAMVKMHIRF